MWAVAGGLGVAAVGAGTLAFKVRERPMDRAENRRKVLKTLPGVDIPEGVKLDRFDFVTSKNIRLAMVEFHPAGPSKGVICICHGYADQMDWLWYPRCLRLAQKGFTVIGLDLEGHGRSDGILVYVPSFLRLVEGAFEAFQSRRSNYADQKWFLCGESMGGAVALWILLKFGQEKWNGAWLICPMCKIAEEMVPPKPVALLLESLAGIIPTWPVVPSPSIVDRMFRNPEYAELIRLSPYYVTHKPRIATALQMLEATNFINANMEQITVPYLLLHGQADVVTDPKLSEELFRRSQSRDKQFQLYPNFPHGIYEDPEGEMAWQDTLKWLSDHL